SSRSHPLFDLSPPYPIHLSFSYYIFSLPVLSCLFSFPVSFLFFLSPLHGTPLLFFSLLFLLSPCLVLSLPLSRFFSLLPLPFLFLCLFSATSLSRSLLFAFSFLLFSSSYLQLHSFSVLFFSSSLQLHSLT
ncbi:unnamed protein product, partial [Prunus brigantina]